MNPVEVATILPPSAREKLRAACEIDPGVLPGESYERARKLDQAIALVKLLFPRFFK